MLERSELEFLSGVSLFAGIGPEAIATIGKLARRVDLESKQVLFREGKPAREMVVVLSGRLDVVKRGARGGEACIATLGAGDVAGEMSLIDIQARSADVRATGSASVIVLSNADIAVVYRENRDCYPLLVLNIAREISLRLRRTDAALANIMLEIGAATGKAGVVSPILPAADE